MSTDNSFTGILDNIKKDQDKLRDDVSTLASNLMKLTDEVKLFIKLHNEGNMESSRDILVYKYNQLTEKQQNLFFRMYQCKPEDLPEDKIKWALRQCEATVKAKE